MVILIASKILAAQVRGNFFTKECVYVWLMNQQLLVVHCSKKPAKEG